MFAFTVLKPGAGVIDYPHPGPLPEGEGDVERAARDFHGSPGHIRVDLHDQGVLLGDAAAVDDFLHRYTVLLESVNDRQRSEGRRFHEGATLVVEDACSVEDWVEIGGHAGLVEHMGLRAMRLRDLSGDTDTLQSRLQQVTARGVPNYFGEQRFGRGGSNLVTAARLFDGSAGRLSRHQRGLALSAARAFLFNRVLGRRVAAGNWDRLLPGEAVQLAGSHSFFVAETLDAELGRRLQNHDIHPTGPMSGKGEPAACGECRQLEDDCLQPFADWVVGLAAAGLKQERRALRVIPANLTWSWPEENELLLEFSLPAGSYATSVLRELLLKAE